MNMSVPSPQTLVDLPNEVLGDIIKELKGKDISNLRLTCKFLGVIGAASLVEQVHIMHLPKSYENLLKLADHPTLREYVKRVYCETNTFVPLDFQQWKDNISSDEQHLPPEKQAAGWAKYQKLFAGLEKYQREGKDFECLEAMFRFPNVKEISLHWSYNKDISDQMLAAFSSTLNDAFNDKPDVEYEARHLKAMLKAMRAVKESTKLETFTVSSFHWSVFDKLGSPSPYISFLSFSTLKHLNLRFNRPPSYPANNQRFLHDNYSKLGVLVRHSRKLETLTLDFDTEPRVLLENGFPPYFAPAWDELSREQTWSSLRSLRLGVVNMSERHITNFMRRHASTLKTLHFSSILLQGNWIRTLQQWKKALKLGKVEFKGMFYELDPPENAHMYHYPMSNDISEIHPDLGERQELGTSLAKFLVKGEDDEDPFDGWVGSCCQRE